MTLNNSTRHFVPATYGRALVGSRIKVALEGKSSTFLEFQGEIQNDDPINLRAINSIGHHMTKWAIKALAGWKVLSVKSDRDVLPEAKAEGKCLLDSNGAGLTRLLQSLMYRDENNRLDLIEGVLLQALNEILMPDNQYERILMREKNGLWEIFLDEKLKGPVPLSSTGSGIKTILLVLANLLIVPELLTPAERHKFIFAFEELENNLHPATLRRLFQYIRWYSNKFKCHFFITTHSHIVIDMFSGDDNAQILHLTHDGESTSIRTIESHAHGVNVLDDLDVRASDLLQTNVVIWVEGPTDAMYFERWIDLHSNGKVRRGVDYQCVNYGGSVVSHLTFDADTADKLIEATKICRHAIFIADSNRSEVDSKLCEQAIRVSEEVKNAGGSGWITDGREIENYLPVGLISSEAKSSLVNTTKYTDIYNAIRTARGNKTEMSKILLANRIVPQLTAENMYRDDLKKRLTEVCEQIGLWNRKTS